MSDSLQAALVIPFHNEEKRLSLGNLEELLEDDRLSIYLVDDGSRDSTREILKKWQSKNSLENRVKILTLAKNVGKANAVRLGMRLAVADGFRVVGQMDADASIRKSDLLLGLDLIWQNENIYLVSAARVRLAGLSVSRDPARQWIGRIVATLVFLVTSIPMYDPQSPLKWWRFSGRNSSALDSNLETYWFGEVELILRLSGGERNTINPPILREFPIQFWKDDTNSHFGNIRSYLRVLSDLQKLFLISSRERRKKRPFKR